VVACSAFILPKVFCAVRCDFVNVKRFIMDSVESAQILFAFAILFYAVARTRNPTSAGQTPSTSTPDVTTGAATPNSQVPLPTICNGPIPAGYESVSDWFIGRNWSVW